MCIYIYICIYIYWCAEHCRRPLLPYLYIEILVYLVYCMGAPFGFMCKVFLWNTCNYHIHTQTHTQNTTPTHTHEIFLQMGHGCSPWFHVQGVPLTTCKSNTHTYTHIHIHTFTQTHTQNICCKWAMDGLAYQHMHTNTHRNIRNVCCKWAMGVPLGSCTGCSPGLHATTTYIHKHKHTNTPACTPEIFLPMSHECPLWFHV